MSVWYAVGGDCEQVRSGLLAQPANAVSAAGYLLAGGLLVWVCRRWAAPHRYWWFAAAVAANGVGSGLYHGPGWPGSGWCHDVAAVAVPVFVAADGLGGIRGWDDRTVTRVGLTATAAVAAGRLAGPVTDLAMVTAVTAAGLAEAAVARRRGRRAGGAAGAGLVEAAVARRRGRRAGGAAGAGLVEAAVARRRGPRAGRVARAAVVATLAVGLAAYLLGRTGGPLCRPDSLLQPHALWHILTAAAMAAWAADRIAHPTPARTAPGGS